MRKIVEVHTDGEHVFIELDGLQYAFSRLDCFKEDNPKLTKKILKELN